MMHLPHSHSNWKLLVLLLGPRMVVVGLLAGMRGCRSIRCLGLHRSLRLDYQVGAGMLVLADYLETMATGKV
jgi:hypothetical protein